MYIPDSVKTLGGEAFNKMKNPSYTIWYVTTKKSTLNYTWAYIKPVYQLYTYTFVDAWGNVLWTWYYPDWLESNTTRLIPTSYYNWTGNIGDFTRADSLIDPGEWHMIEWSIPLKENAIVTGNQVVTGSIVTAYTVTFKNPFTWDIIEYAARGHYVEEPEEYEVEGYTFTGWYLWEDKVEFPLQVTSSIVLSWVYSINSYTINFYTGEDSSVAYTWWTYEYQTAIQRPNNPSREGWNFIGWYYLSWVVEKFVNFPLTLTKDTVLYAGWDNVEDTETKYWTDNGCFQYRRLNSWSVEILDYSDACPRNLENIWGIPSSIQRWWRSYAVARIGTWAFYGWYNAQTNEYLQNYPVENRLTGHVVIPDTVKEIGNASFRDNMISEIDLWSWVEKIDSYAFQWRYWASVNPINTIHFPASLRVIGSWAFNYLSQLNTVTFEEWLERIEYSAFQSSRLSWSVILPKSLRYLWSYAFATESYINDFEVLSTDVVFGSRNVIAPNGCWTLRLNGWWDFTTSKISVNNSFLHTLILWTWVTWIWDRVFELTNITWLVIPDSVRYIWDSAFWTTSRLETVVIGNWVESIWSLAFDHATNLSTLTLWTGLRSIWEYAFRNSNITGVVIPNSVETIWDFAFENISNLSTLTLWTGLRSIWGYAFNGINITGVVIPDSVETIGQYAFERNKNLKTVKLWTWLNVLNNYVFHNSTWVESVDLGKVTYIWKSNFANAQLTGIIIPSTVTGIAESAFENNEDLVSIVFEEWSVLESIGTWAFKNANISSIDLPSTLTTLGEEVLCSDETSSPDAIIGIITHI